MREISDIRSAFKSKTISREEYWTEMRAHYLLLGQFHQIVRDTHIRSIELTSDEIVLVTQMGVRLVWDPNDIRSAPSVIANYGDYEFEDRKLLLALGCGCKSIFDVGANMGFYTLNWARVLPASTIVHAFEPVPSTYSRLVRNITINSLQADVRVNNFGFSDEAKTLKFFLPSFSGSGAASIANQHPTEKTVEVLAKVDTLDAYVEREGIRSIDLMKVDVEGAELLVLRGGMSSIGRLRPVVFMELLRKWSKSFGYHPNDVIRIFRDMNYFCMTFEDSQLVPFEWMDDETVQTNFLFLPAEKREIYGSALAPFCMKLAI